MKRTIWVVLTVIALVGVLSVPVWGTTITSNIGDKDHWGTGFGFPTGSAGDPVPTDTFYATGSTTINHGAIAIPGGEVIVSAYLELGLWDWGTTGGADYVYFNGNQILSWPGSANPHNSTYECWGAYPGQTCGAAAIDVMAYLDGSELVSFNPSPGEYWGIDYSWLTIETVRDPGPIGEIPEPSTFLLLGGGLVGVWFLRRRRMA